jgi:branched-chain amino acid transport system substrate-binding protein
VIQDIPETGARQGPGDEDEVGQVLYTRGVIVQMLSVEAVRRT